ncbi:hypothetical protein ACIA8O_25790 [Kitasatospora sp. NPDC051853]|uniref:hypothetical protein n=1 Tax=Kitasatospora sp. NPDC051853 TaxID=3364058 RepID=UPI0037A87E87
MIDTEDLAGRRLLRVTAARQQHPEAEPSLLHMWWHLEGLGPVRFSAQGRELTLELTLEPDRPDAPHDTEAYGHATVEDDPPGFPVTGFVGEQIRSVRRVRHRYGADDFADGVTVRFPMGSVRILNLAGELVLQPSPLNAWRRTAGS